MAHSDETKAQVIAALLAGQGIADVASQYAVPESTVRRWPRHVPAATRAQIDQEMAANKDIELGALIADYLVENLTTLTAQVRHFRSNEWLSKQDASEAAVLHGVLTDKAIRILGALEAVDEAG